MSSYFVLLYQNCLGYFSFFVFPYQFFFFFFSPTPCGMQDLNSPTRDQTRAPCIGNVESQPLDCQGSPSISVLDIISNKNNNPTGILIRAALNLYISFWRINIFPILRPPIHGESMSLYLFRYLLSFISIL